MKIRILLASTMLLLSSAALLKAQPDDLEAQDPMVGPRMRLFAELKLIDDQKKQMEQMRVDLAKQLIAHRAKTSTARLELQQLLRADNPGKAAIEKKLNELGQLQTQGRMQMVNQWFNVNKILTPEQQKVWKKALGQRQFAGRGQMMRGGRGGMMRMGRGPMMRGGRGGLWQGDSPPMREFQKRMMPRNRMDF